MSGYWIDVVVVGFLVIVNAAFAGTEMALVSLREGQLRALESGDHPRARRLVRLARDPSRFLATIQIGITLSSLLASATAAVSLAKPLVPRLSFLGDAAEPVAVAAVTVVLTFLMLVFGELVPKRLAMQAALRWARVAAAPLTALSALARPAVWLLAAVVDAVMRLAGRRPEVTAEAVTREELREIVTGQPGLTPEQRGIIAAALQINERTLREVLVPRGQVFAVPDDLPTRQAQQQLAAAGHSRAPVVHGRRLDDTVGIVHWAALIGGGDRPVRELMTPAPVLPDTLPLPHALHELMANRQQLALVIDEHGSVDGIITLEDLVEEIVGDIYDETDLDLAGAVEEPHGSFLLPGTFPVHDLPDLGVHVREEPQAGYATVAGLILWHLRSLPRSPGDVVSLDGWQFQVTEVSGHAITAVRVQPAPPAEPA